MVDTPNTAIPPGQTPETYAAGLTAAAQGFTGQPVPATQADVAAAQRPAWAPEKFWNAQTGQVNVEAMAQSYRELETRFSSKAAEPAQDQEATTETTPATPPATSETPKTSLKVEAPANTFEPVFTEIATKFEGGQEITDEDIAKVTALGIPEKFVRQYISGVRADAAQAQLAAEQAAGGAEALNSALAWAASGLNDQELAFFNDNVDDPAKRAETIRWLVSKHQAANPSEGTLVSGEPSHVTSDVFNSAAEAQEAINSDRYRRDPAFQLEVAKKIVRSKQAGTMTSSVETFGF